MISRELYKEAMDESLKNAEMFVYEAKLIAEKASQTHALLLKNLAIEEIAKAYVCGMVAYRVIPLNHPIVWPKSKKTIFRSHDVKNRVYIDIASAHMLQYMQKSGLRETGPITTGEITGISIVTQFMGKEGTKKRSEWMYVDIVQDKKKNWYVSSPLLYNEEVKPPDFNHIDAIIGFIKRIIAFAESSHSADNLEKVREDTRKLDPEFPDDPIWDI